MKVREHTEYKGINPKHREVVGILLLALAAISLVSIYSQSAGLVGKQIRVWMELAFGQAAPAFSLILVFIAVQIFRGRLWPIPWRQTIGFLCVLVTLVTIFHLQVYQGYQLPPSLEEELAYAQEGEGAGVVGAVMMVMVLTGFGFAGGYVVLGALLLIGIIFFFDISLTLCCSAVVNKIKQFFAWIYLGTATRLQEKKTQLKDWKEKREFQKMQSLAQFEEGAATEGPRGGKPKQSEKSVKQKTRKSRKTPPEVTEKTKERSPESVDKTEEEAPTLELNPQPGTVYQKPPLYLLKKGVHKLKKTNQDSQKQLLEDTFQSFGISARVVNVSQGPVVTRYELQPAPGVKVSKITSLADDLALSLAAEDVRIEAPVPGKAVIGIEVPNSETVPVLLRDVLESSAFADHNSKVSLALGQDIAGNPVVADLKKWLHLLVAGATGSGKSVCLNSMIASILYKATPDEVRLLMIDPKRVELAVYDGIPHLISPVVTDPKKAATALRWAVAEMERRYKLFADTGVRNIDMYAQLPKELPTGGEREDLPYVVIIVDELADLMMVAAAEVEDAICRLAQMARAAGMYLIIATQRPSVDVITGLIKANVPSRIAFSVSSQVDSRTILDMSGAERLIGKGDMLFYPLGASKPTRAQGAWIADSEVEALVRFWKKQGEPEYQEEVLEEKSSDMTAANADEDELLEDAVRLVVDTGQASISMLQRRFRIGYSRAARLIDMMEVRGIVGSYQGSKPREVLIDSASLEERGE